MWCYVWVKKRDTVAMKGEKGQRDWDVEGMWKERNIGERGDKDIKATEEWKKRIKDYGTKDINLQWISTFFYTSTWKYFKKFDSTTEDSQFLDLKILAWK